jgi:hypothetical protein
MNMESTTFQYVLTDRETRFWDHNDDAIRDWFRREVRHKACDLARTHENPGWSIRHPDETELDHGAIG